MGAVYLAWQPRLERLVAVKVLPFSSALQPHLAARFRREIAAVGRLRHPTVVTAFDADQHDGIHYLLMEYVEGETLSQFLRREGPLPVEAACEVIRQVATGMQHVHESGLVHRDLKPSNLMLTADGRVRILDLGLARFQVDENRPCDEITTTGQIMGTIEYMPPEQAAGADVADVRSDVYGLGATLFKLIRGRSLLETATPSLSRMQRVARLVSDPPTLADVDTSGFPESVCRVLERMLAVDPADRFSSAEEVVTVLQPLSRESALLEVASRVQPALCEPLPDARDIETADLAGSALTGRGGQQSGLAQSQRVPADETKSVRAGRSRVRRLMIAVTGVLGVLAVMLGAFVIRLSKDGAEIEITSDDPDVELEIVRNAEVIDGFAVGSGGRITWYRSGQYEIRLASNPDDRIQIRNSVFELTRDHRQVVRIERIPLKVEPAVLPASSDEPQQKLPRITVSSPEQIAKWLGDGPSPTEILTSDEWEWTEPQCLGMPFNSWTWESSFAISADQDVLAFSSARPGGVGDRDVWLMYRSADGKSWSDPVNAGPDINTPAGEGDVTLTANGQAMLFSRSVSERNSDLFLSRRVPGSTEFEAPVPLGPMINSLVNEQSPYLSPDGLTLLFVRSSEGSESDLYSATRGSVDEPFGNVVALDAVNSRTSDFRPFLTLDGNSLIFASRRDGTLTPNGQSSLWMSNQMNPGHEWSPPVRLGPEVTTWKTEYNMTLSPDGQTAWFVSQGPRDWPASIFFDKTCIWTANRVRRSAITPLEVHTSDAWTWTPKPRPEHEPLATKDVTSVSLSGDELTMVASVREPGSDSHDELKQFIRPSRSQAWTEHSELLRLINQDDVTITAPEISSDGLMLVYARPKPDSEDDLDLWMATRATPDSAWESPVPLANVNSDSRDNGPTLSADGLTLIFATTRNGWRGASDLWQSQRASLDEAFGKPVSLGSVVNSDARDMNPELSSDGLVLMFGSARPNAGSVGLGIWMSTRATLQDEWSTPVSLPWAVNRDLHERCPELSHDGRSLYFIITETGKDEAGSVSLSSRLRRTPVYGGNLLARHIGSMAWNRAPAVTTISGIDRFGKPTGVVRTKSDSREIDYVALGEGRRIPLEAPDAQWMFIDDGDSFVIWNAARQECLTATSQTQVECAPPDGSQSQLWKRHTVMLGQYGYYRFKNLQTETFLAVEPGQVALVTAESLKTEDQRFRGLHEVTQLGGTHADYMYWANEKRRFREIQRAIEAGDR